MRLRRSRSLPVAGGRERVRIGRSGKGAAPGLEVYEYPGKHDAKGAGEGRAKLRLEAEEAFGQRLSGTSYCRGMSAGHTFTLADHDRDSANADYVVLSVLHAAESSDYSNSFVAFPKTLPFRPPRLTPRPSIYGAQTAVVVGKSGEEIWTDKYGRIKVQFHWDRLGKRDETSSCWVRVAQGWAGKTFGAIFLPRVGQEVVVTFVGGDPDRPLIIGSVYNGQQSTPYPLPAEATKSAIKTHSSKDGSGFNEIRFEDKKGKEELFLHAEKDYLLNVKHDAQTVVEHDAKIKVKNHLTTVVEEGDETHTVSKGKRTVEVKEGDENHSVKGKRTKKVTGDESYTNEANFIHKTKGAYTLKVDGDLTFDVKAAIVIKGGTSISIKAGTEATVESGTALTHKAGTELTNKAGTNLTNDAAISLTNKAGASQTVDGGGMLTIKGGMVKIN